VQLLVSVRSVAEVGSALRGGADIIDAKEPGHGSLGAVSREVLAEIIQLVPNGRALSVALGDLMSPAEVFATIESLPLSPRLGPVYLKLGFAGVSSLDLIGSLLSAAVVAAKIGPAAAHIVAVAYADAARARSVSPHSLVPVAAAAGATGILVDTYGKDGSGLLRWMELEALAGLGANAHRAGLFAALAGELGLEDMALIVATRADVVGVRGAACIGGRQGRVSSRKVEALRRALRAAPSGYVQAPGEPANAGSRNA
jgi:(5-formylfuran-3-yl)methyl phosphate synthase